MRERIIVPLSCALLVCACGAPDAEEPAAAAGAPAGAAEATAASPSAAQRARAAVNGCEIVQGEDVVRIAGGAKLSLAPTAYPGGCMYVVELADGTAQRYQFRYENPDVEVVLIDALTPEEKTDRIDGPWDEAWLARQQFSGLRLLAVRRGDFGLEVSGDRTEPMVELAKLAASRAAMAGEPPR